MVIKIHVASYLYFSKAKRCYQKAFDLDSDLAEAGNRLVGCLMALNERVRMTTI